ncbi:MAG: DUF4342 domain-containing protein [Tissierellia bacterium]|nr:DUF4342 domain-containing protein [Tissierellia bacterium]MDD4780271.1 DUF4342 domain-containing protein [Tissierellia bacterium]
MKVTLEQIDELRSRVNVTYEEAKATLEKNDGDLIKSIIELEKKKGYKRKEHDKDGFAKFANKLLELKFLVKSKNGRTLIDVPIVLVLIVFLLAFWVVIFGILLALLTSCKIKIYRDKNSINVHGIKRNMQETVEKIKVKSEEFIEDFGEPTNVNEDNEDNEDYDGTEENEIIIE